MSHIVVIEDNAQSARLVAKLLVKSGHNVRTFLTGEAGLTNTFETLPDLVLIDLGLPDIDGQTVISLLRQQPKLSKTSVIAFTAWPPETAYMMAKAYGCDGVITKPINTRIFVEQVEDFLPKSPTKTGDKVAMTESLQPTSAAVPSDNKSEDKPSDARLSG